MRYLALASALLAITVSLTVLAMGGCHSGSSMSAMGKMSMKSMSHDQPMAHHGPAAPGNTVRIAVTDKGFEPASATVTAGKPVTLIVTRKTDDTCATSILVPQEHIDAKLPLNQPVTLHFTPSKAGELAFMCGEGMIKGSLLVKEE